MLYLAVFALLALVNGQYLGPTLSSRQFFLIDTCVNVSDGAFGSAVSSEICHCSERSVHCNSYTDTNCSDYYDDSIYGGCTTSYTYRVDNCAAAQEVAAGGVCPYWEDTAENYYPLYYCRDYGCGGGYLSCKDSRDTATTIQRTYYNDYTCDPNYFATTAVFNAKYIQNGDGSSNCGVTLTTYSNNVLDGCGSKKSPYDSGSNSGECNYFKETNSAMPTAIDVCTYTRYGYYEYSGKYMCSDDGTEVYLYHYLDSKTCAGDGYKVRTISNQNATVVCDKGTCSGKYGFYSGCGNYNWDAFYSEGAVPFGKCIAVYSDPDDGTSGFKQYEKPWYYNSSVVFTCNGVRGSGGGSYPSVYYYPDTSDCSGQYTFNFDIFGYVSQLSSYKGLDCAYVHTKGCDQGSTVDEENVPGLSICSSAFRSIPQFIVAIIAVVALFV